MLPKLSQKYLADQGISLPLPSEKVLQFGTGVLLRGLCDYFIDKANKQGVFNGRIVVVKSTSTGSADAFQEQDGLYTQLVWGIENGETVDEIHINSAISRTLSAQSQWQDILACAANPEMQVVISNTTEVGIQYLDGDSVSANPPTSFPVKLLAFLHERFKVLGGSTATGMVIIPTELLVDNGLKLKEIVIKQAHSNQLEAEFITWLETENSFCSSLVDRIVPGKPDADTIPELGYTDDLIIMSEVYRLWAIEGDQKVKDVLTFCQADAGVMIEPDIEIYRELKLRLLNGTHTLSCGLAYLMGFNIVREGMENASLRQFVEDLMLQELLPAIPYSIEKTIAENFGKAVIDRFSNPFLRHRWLDITVQYSAKMKMRNMPLLLNHYQQSQEVPERFALGFAAYLYFMKPVKVENGQYFGERGGENYPIRCDQAPYFYEVWQKNPTLEELTKTVLQNTELWGADLTQLAGFQERVTELVAHVADGNWQLANIELGILNQ